MKVRIIIKYNLFKKIYGTSKQCNQFKGINPNM